MKITAIITTACAFAAASNVFAGVLTFDSSAPAAGTDVHNFYNGITFGIGERVVAGTPGFPPKTPTMVLEQVNPNNSVINFGFDTAQKSFSFFYTSLDGFTGVAENASGTIVDTFTGAANTDGAIGTSTQISVTDATADIKTVIITDDANKGDETVIDNISAAGVSGLARPKVGTPSGSSVPDSASTLGLFGATSIALLAIRRKLAVQQ